MMKLHVLFHGNWSFNYDPTELSRMQNLGITDRLQRLQIERVFEISSQMMMMIPRSRGNTTEKVEKRENSITEEAYSIQLL